MPSIAPVMRATSASVAGSTIENESSKRFTTQARTGPPVASSSTWNGLSPTGMPWMPVIPAFSSTKTWVPVL